MTAMVRRLASAVTLAFALTPPALAAAAGSNDLGKVDFPTSASAAAQSHFVRGVAALHSFWYDEAADAFREAQEAEPGFALAYWGEAMTYNHPVWFEQDLDAARGALARLAPTREERAAKAPTPREKAYLEAVEILYGDGDRKARDHAYAAAMQRLHESFPEDLEASAFYSLSLIGPALAGGIEPDLRVRTLMQAAAVLEEQFDRNPQHPGVVHYLIHAYDDPEHAPLGLRAARIYAEVAPSAHHALHMPSHIFVQIGDWERTAKSNEDSWAASVDWVERRKLSPDKRDFHSLSWLAYAYLQQGRTAKAGEMLEIARQAAKESGSQRTVYAAATMEARQRIETRDGRKAASAPAAQERPAPGGEHAHCSAPSYGRGEAAVLNANGLNAARSGDLAAAEEAVKALRKIAEELKDSDRGARMLEKQVSGMILLAKGQKDAALKLLAEAVDLEAAEPPPSGPPEPMKPAHELYGEALLELGQAKEAAAQFEKSLLRTPNRTASLLGAARAAAKLGDRETAREHYTALAGIWRQADAGLPEVEEAKGYLAQASAR